MPLSQIIGIIGLTALILGFLVSLIWSSIPKNVDEADFIFAGTVNDADCTILVSKGHCVIVDSGEAEDGSHIVELLQKYGVETVDCLILTHPDKDHIGGADAILDNFPVSQVICPHYGQYNSIYTALNKRIDTEGITRTVITDATQIKCGDLKLTIFPPQETFYDDDNDYSLVTLVNHGSVNLLLTADICKVRIGELESSPFPNIQLLKVPYHGRSSNASADFIRRISPDIAVVTAAKAESKIEKTLNKLGCDIYCTVGADRVFRSDGKVISAGN